MFAQESCTDLHTCLRNCSLPGTCSSARCFKPSLLHLSCSHHVMPLTACAMLVYRTFWLHLYAHMKAVCCQNLCRYSGGGPNMGHFDDMMISFQQATPCYASAWSRMQNWQALQVPNKWHIAIFVRACFPENPACEHLSMVGSFTKRLAFTTWSVQINLCRAFATSFRAWYLQGRLMQHTCILLCGLNSSVYFHLTRLLVSPSARPTTCSI